MERRDKKLYHSQIPTDLMERERKNTFHVPHIIEPRLQGKLNKLIRLLYPYNMFDAMDIHDFEDMVGVFMF